MELYLQFGHGMMEHCRSLLGQWGGGTVIHSPRDLDAERMTALARDIRGLGGRNVIDPQFYLPHADHFRLNEHCYWPDEYATGNFWAGNELQEMLGQLKALNDQVGTDVLLTPGCLAEEISDDWLRNQQRVAEMCRAMETGKPVWMTIAIGESVSRTQDSLSDLLDAIENWDVDGYYLIFEHPGDGYLVNNAVWLVNQMDLVAGIKLIGKKAVVGYSNHQQLLLAASKADAICSGTFLNVRAFPRGKFFLNDSESSKQRAKWYYCPQALSEYKVPMLDVARLMGVLDSMRPVAGMSERYCQPLFSGVQPSTADWKETLAFRHFLDNLRIQARLVSRRSLDETFDSLLAINDNARDLTGRLQDMKIVAQQRAIAELLDIHDAVLEVHKTNRGVLLRRRWNTL